MTRVARLVVSITVAMALATATSLARADQVDVPADRDTTLYEESGATSNGAGDWLFAGQTNGTKARRSLVHFDVSAAIPAGSTVTSVTLTMYCSRTKAQGESVALHRALASWGEGTSNATQEEGQGIAATGGDATWTHRVHPSTPWTSAAETSR